MWYSYEDAKQFLYIQSNNQSASEKNLNFAIKAKLWLERSYKKCSAIDFHKEISPDEMDSLEGLTSRFARLADIVIHKVFRSLEAAELEIQGTIIDTVNRISKRGLIESSDQIRNLKDLRNTSSLEYEEDQLVLLMKEVLEKTPELIQILDNTLQYCQSKNYI